MDRSNYLSKKKILVTDYYAKDRPLYGEIIKQLRFAGAIVFGIYNYTTISDQQILSKFPYVTPILIDSTGGVHPAEDSNEDRKIKFNDGFEKVLLDRLPNFDLVFNFAGHEFVQSFLDTPGRPFYRIIEVSVTDPKLSLKTMWRGIISDENKNSIVHVLFEQNQGSDRLLQLNDPIRTVSIDPVTGNLKDVTPTPNPVPTSTNQTPPLISLATMSRLPVLVRSWILMAKRFADERLFGEPPVSYEKRSDQLLSQEIGKLNAKLRKTIRSSTIKYEHRKSKIFVKHTSQFNTINGNISTIESKSKALARGKDRIEEPESSKDAYTSFTKKRSFGKQTSALKTELGKLTLEKRVLERKRNGELVELRDEWYNSILRKQGNLLKSVSKSFEGKRQALDRVHFPNGNRIGSSLD